MTESTLHALRERLDRLERDRRRLKRVAVAVLIGAAAVLLMGQAEPRRWPRTIEAEEFVLRDGRGKIRARLGTTGGPSAAILQIHGTAGTPRARVTVSNDGTSSVEILDSSERVRLLLGVKDDGSPRIWLGDEAGKIVWRAP